MIAVSDTSPINCLRAIGQIEILPKLFGTISIPSAGMPFVHAALVKTLLRRIGRRKWALFASEDCDAGITGIGCERSPSP